MLLIWIKACLIELQLQKSALHLYQAQNIFSKSLALLFDYVNVRTNTKHMLEITMIFLIQKMTFCVLEYIIRNH